jgi:exodeoxyribonuclease VII small subunit
MQKSSKADQAKKFEARLERLEEISNRLKDGSVPLEEAYAHFEEGIKLARGLEKDLTKLERRIEILVNKPDSPEDSPELDLFSGEEE